MTIINLLLLYVYSHYIYNYDQLCMYNVDFGRVHAVDTMWYREITLCVSYTW